MRTKDYAKKEKILDDAIQLINEIGLAEASVAKIAQKSGVSAASLYVYFNNKEDMIKKLFLAAKKKLLESILRDIDPAAPDETAFKRLLHNYAQFCLNHKTYFLFIEQYINSPLLRRLCSEEMQLITRPLLNFFANGTKRGVFKKMDAPLLFIFAVSPLLQIAKRHCCGQMELDEAKIAAIVEWSWEAVRK